MGLILDCHSDSCGVRADRGGELSVRARSPAVCTLKYTQVFCVYIIHRFSINVSISSCTAYMLLIAYLTLFRYHSCSSVKIKNCMFSPRVNILFIYTETGGKTLRGITFCMSVVFQNVAFLVNLPKIYGCGRIL